MPHSSHRELLRHVLAAIGAGSPFITLAGCGGSDDVTLDAAQPDASSDESSTASDASPPGNTGGNPPIVITTQPPVSDADIDAGRSCRQLVVSRDPNPSATICPSEAGDAGDGGLPTLRRSRVKACLPATEAGVSCSDAYNESCVLNTFRCGLAQFGQYVACGPLQNADDQCCYIVEGTCPVGRPFCVGGIARRAPAGTDSSWATMLEPEVDELDADTRAALADVWTKEGLAEHASVASFSRFVLQCLAAGAPADIVQGAQQACADEIEHARIAFGLASAYAGRPVGPGRLDITKALDESRNAVDIACSVAAEGCIAELVSASLLAAACDQMRDGAVKTALARIAEQELAHALLAWRYLAWACSTGDAHLHAQVARIFDRMHDHVGFGAQTSLRADDARMRTHGYLPLDERRRIATAVLKDVIAPAKTALLNARPSALTSPRHAP